MKHSTVFSPPAVRRAGSAARSEATTGGHGAAVLLPLRDAGAIDPIRWAIEIAAKSYPIGASDGEKYAWMDDLQQLIEASARRRGES